MPNEILTGARYPLGTDVPNIAQYIQNAVNDLADNTIPRFASPAARDTAFSSWVSAGNSMTPGLVCFTQSDGRFWRYDTASSSWLYAGGNPPPIALGVAAAGWNNGTTAPGAYKDSSGLVHLTGVVAPQTTYNPQDGGTHTALTLPAGYYPARSLYVYAFVPTATMQWVTLLVPANSGSVNVVAGTTSSIGANSGHYLDGIHYHSTGTGVPFS